MKFLEHQWSSCYISLKCIQHDLENFRMLCRYPSCLPSPVLCLFLDGGQIQFFSPNFHPLQSHEIFIWVRPQDYFCSPIVCYRTWWNLGEVKHTVEWNLGSFGLESSLGEPIPKRYGHEGVEDGCFRTAGRDIGGVLKFRWEWTILLVFCMAFCWQFETRVAQGWRSRWLRFQRQVWSLSIAFYFGDIRAFRMAYRAVCVSSAHAGENFNSTGSFVLGFIMRECLMNGCEKSSVFKVPLVMEQNLRSKGNSSKMLCRFVNYVSLPIYKYKINL